MTDQQLLTLVTAQLIAAAMTRPEAILHPELIENSIKAAKAIIAEINSD